MTGSRSLLKDTLSHKTGRRKDFGQLLSKPTEVHKFLLLFNIFLGGISSLQLGDRVLVTGSADQTLLVINIDSIDDLLAEVLVNGKSLKVEVKLPKFRLPFNRTQNNLPNE